MKSIASAAALVAVVALTAGCAATTDDGKPVEPRQPREYRTGSNMPVREPSKPMTQEERDKEQQKLREMQQSSGRAAGATTKN